MSFLENIHPWIQDQGLQCNPDCQRFIQNDETALSAENGFYWKFESDPDTGRPFGCPGFDDKWLQGMKVYKRDRRCGLLIKEHKY